MEDSQKVQSKVKELNSGLSSSPWVPIDGYYSLLKTDLIPTGATFYGNQGLPLKTFLNRETGEVRMFPAKAFEQ